MALHPDLVRSFSRDFMRSARRVFGLSPMQQVLRELEHRGVDLASLTAVELFGGCAKRHTLDYANRVAGLEAWEIEPSCEEMLRKNIRGGTVRIVDTFEEIRKTSQRFDLIVIDNPMSIYGGHCEHFELFPDVFRLVGDSAIFVIDVIPNVPPDGLRKFPYLFSEQHLALRRQFYQAEKADDLSREQIVSAYRRSAETAGLKLEWNFWVRRHFVYYLAFKVRRLV
jgi:hypothetical protein